MTSAFQPFTAVHLDLPDHWPVFPPERLVVPAAAPQARCAADDPSDLTDSDREERLQTVLSGVLSVASLPILLHHASVPTAGAAISTVLLLAAGAVSVQQIPHPVPTSFAVGFAAGVITGALADAAARFREGAGVGRPAIAGW